MRPDQARIHRALYAVLAGCVSHYAYLLPIAAMGMWRARLMPGMNFISMSAHLFFMGAVWLAFGTRRSSVVALALVIAFGLAVNQFLDGWPIVGMDNFELNWAANILHYFLSPLLMFGLLWHADVLGRHIIRGWKSHET